MAESVQLEARKRTGRGTRAAERLRQEGRIPGVVYGHKEETVSVSVSKDDLVSVIRHRTTVVDLKTDGGVQKAQISEVQWDHLGKEVLHVDFKRVRADERIEVRVPVELRGIAPGVTAGGILDQPLHALTIECLAVSVPESIRVNIGELQLGGAIHVRDLPLPPGAKALDDPDAVVVHITAPQVEAPPAVEVVPGAAEPEVITRRAAEEGAAEQFSEPQMAEGSERKIVVGLGNPGSRYHGTRHNVGFAVVDYLAASPRTGRFQSRFDAQVAELEEDGRKVLLVKPETFMNLSGRCVRQILDFYRVPVEGLLVVCDDINLPLGKLRVRARGTHGGHNGLRDIQAHLGTTEYARLRLGVGAPREDAVDYVLGRFRPAERAVIDDAVALAGEAVGVWVRQGVEVCMNRYNAGTGKAQE